MADKKRKGRPPGQSYPYLTAPIPTSHILLARSLRETSRSVRAVVKLMQETGIISPRTEKAYGYKAIKRMVDE